MAQLTPEIQTFIVAEFALAKSGAAIVKSVKKEFGIDLDRQQVWHYNPDNPQLAEKWKTLFAQLREKVISDVHGVVGAHKAWRLRQLLTLYWRALEVGNDPLAANLIEQMAKEEGGMFTNTRNVNVNPRDALAAFLGVDAEQLPEGAVKKGAG